MKKIAVVFASLAFSVFSYADVAEEAISCEFSYCLQEYGSLLTKLCDKGNTRACNTLSKIYYKNYDSSNGDYYACKAGVTEMCHDSSTAPTQEEAQTCITEEERMAGCVHREYVNALREFVEIPYKNGKINGVVKSRYKSGQLAGETSYKDDKRCGIRRLYHENGQLSFETPFKDGKREGVQKQYDEEGRLQGEVIYRNDEMENEKSYYENGMLKSEASYNKMGGHDWKTYYENGQLDTEISYKNDYAMHGTYKQYYENGNIKITIPYNNGKRSDTQKWYYENGNLLAEIPYLEGKPNGIIKYYLTGNKLLWQITAQKGELINGKCVSGKTLTNSHFEKILNDINIGKVDNWHAICQ